MRACTTAFKNTAAVSGGVGHWATCQSNVILLLSNDVP